MEIKPAHFYELVVSVGSAQRKSRVYNLRISKTADRDGNHLIYYYDCGTTHSFEGKIVRENMEMLVFEIKGGKQFIFTPLSRRTSN
jgi:hypothetical protein